MQKVADNNAIDVGLIMVKLFAGYGISSNRVWRSGGVNFVGLYFVVNFTVAVNRWQHLAWNSSECCRPCSLCTL